MKKTSKILVTVVAVLMYIVFGTLILGSMKDAGMSTGFVGLILLVALIGALKAVWRKPKSENEDKNKTEGSDNASILQK